jgi:response regulator RpfG family c-di-GMP phosphodiesterase
MGYRVLNADDGFDAIKLAALEKVDAVVLDLDRNDVEVDLVAAEIKPCRPQVRRSLWQSRQRTRNLAQEPADALVLKKRAFLDKCFR